MRFLSYASTLSKYSSYILLLFIADPNIEKAEKLRSKMMKNLEMAKDRVQNLCEFQYVKASCVQHVQNPQLVTNFIFCASTHSCDVRSFIWCKPIC